LRFSCRNSEWNENRSEFKKNHPNYIQRNTILNKFRVKASSIIDDYRSDGIDFTLNQFEERFRGDYKRKDISVYDFFDYKVDLLIEAGRTGSAKSYKDTRDAIFKFYPRIDLKFQKIDVHFLDRGIQYCSNVYTQILKRKKINISMTEENHCYENAIAERVNGI